MSQYSPFRALVISICAISTFQIGYVVAQVVPSPASTMLLMFAPAFALVFWIEDDARHRRYSPCYDFGFLMLLFFPASLIWYAVWSRGRWGLLAAIALLGLMFIPSFCAIIIWGLLYGAN